VSAKNSGGRVITPNRRPTKSAATKPPTSHLHDGTGCRQEPAADALFGIAGNSYGTPGWALSNDEDDRSGLERKRDGQRFAETMVDNGWRTRADRVIDELAATGQSFTAETVRARLADDAITPAAFGSRFTAAARRGAIRKTGHYIRAQRASRNAGVLAEWIGTR